jgi:hypothetical protein
MNSPRNCQCSAASTTTGKRWAAEVFTALGEQTVVVSGTGAVGIVLPQLAAQLVQLRTFPRPGAGPTSRAYYDRERAEGKRHNQALIALARRRCDVLFAMLRDMTLYETPQIKAA